MERIQNMAKDPVIDIVNSLQERVINPRGENNSVLRAVLERGQVAIDCLEPHLPQVSQDEVASKQLKKVLASLKKLDASFFGSVWNETTAIAASIRLGVKPKELKKSISEPNISGQRIREAQSTISKEAEVLALRKIRATVNQDMIKRTQIEAWVAQLTEESTQEIKRLCPNLSKQDREKAIKDCLMALVEILHFCPKVNVEPKTILKSLIKGRLGNPIDLVALHCLSFVNSEEKGIEVSLSAEEFVATNGDGSKVLITQSDSLDKVNEFATILNNNNISFNLLFFVVDNDSFVLPGQESRLNKFIESLEGVIGAHSVSKNKFIVTKASELMNPEDLAKEWDKRANNAGKLTETSVDEEFERLQRRSLPAKMKTRSFARNIARKNFLVQVSVGHAISTLSENAIVGKI